MNLLYEMYELDGNAAKILVGSKLQGKALDWYRSRTEYLSMSLDELFQEMEPMFNQPLGQLEARCQFEDRKWQRSESFSDYCHSKVILGNQVPVANEKIIDYIIDGISSENLQNQARMNSFSSISELLKIFKRIKLLASDTCSAKQEVIAGKNTRYKKHDKVEGSKEPASEKPVGKTKLAVCEAYQVLQMRGTGPLREGLSFKAAKLIHQ